MIGCCAVSDPHEMDKFLENFHWNDLNPDDQVMIGLALLNAAEVRPDMLTREELDDIARFVRFAQRRKAARRKNGLAAS